ncbi:hypothetical protein V7793_11630 [Streptomyces sp. KLMMK]|uniref:hypothetical protein n=1 Tax=Streptomyces sp. KLMMK TaxID=3109353 RepID=UPI00300BEEA2
MKATGTKAKTKVPGERIMWVCLAGCLAAALAAPLFGDDPKAVAIPGAAAVSIAVGIAWLRKKQTQ